MSTDTRHVSVQALLKPFAIEAPDIYVNNMVLDSRDVSIHALFVAIKGHARDGREFIPQAISLGAKVILSECDAKQEHGKVEMREQSLIISFFALPEKLSELAAKFFGDPSAALDVVAVTGTNGKTSTVQLITQLRHLLGQTSASIGTLGAGIYQENAAEQSLDETLNTTPDAIKMQQLLADFSAQGVAQVALEASSHALVQGRISALRTRVAAFTNLTRDHLDYHGSMAKYAAAKRLLMKQPDLRYLLLNYDDKESRAWLEQAPAQVEIVLFSTQLPAEKMPADHAHCVVEDVDFLDAGCQFLLKSSWGSAQIQSGLLGQFNIANMLMAIGSQLVQGFNLKDVANRASLLKPVPGRMEVFTNPHGANIVVDYAHTPDALEQALKAARHHCRGRLHVIFGCGGDRDQGKRSLMGEVAEQGADKILLTNDNSRSEPPDAIIQDILSGCAHPERISVQLDRTLAINQALEMAEQDDLILLAGKGHETYQIIGENTLPYNERNQVAAILEGKAL